MTTLHIITANKEHPIYTNSTQIPVDYTDDIFEVIEKQDELQSLYTGGTVLHIYMGDRIDDRESAKALIRKIFTNYKMPYISLTPTFSICPEHGYLKGEQFECPHCHKETEVWSRIVGYLRPIQNYNDSKKEEYLLRKKFVLKKEELN